MKLKIYKQALLMLIAFLALGLPAIAQEARATPEPPAAEIQEVIVPEISVFTAEHQAGKSHDIKIKLKKLDKAFARNLSKSLKNLDKNLSKNLDNLGAQIAAGFNHFEAFDVSVDADIQHTENGETTTATTNGPQEDKVKVYSKSYSVDRDDILEINNKYGNININTWNKNEFKIEIKVSVNSSRAGEAERMMDNIKISDARVGNTVSFTTQFNSEVASNSWSFFGRKKSVRNSEIVYNVYMPAKNTLTINSKYSGINLPELYGKVAISNTYGSLYAKALNNMANDLNLKYCDVDINQLGGGSLNLSYGSLKLGKVGKLEANINYAPVTVGQLLTSGDFNIKYGGGLKIDELGAGLKTLNVNSAYSNVNIGLNGKENFDFDVTISYNSFKYNNDMVKITDQTPGDESHGFQPTKNYKGHVGRANTNTRVVITNKYQGVSIK